MTIKEATARTPKSITIRRATPEDASEVERLAQLEGARAPAGDFLVADVDGELWAAAELSGGGMIADPFRPSGDVAELLRMRLERLNGNGRRRGLRSWLALGRTMPWHA
jgi:hypothetical protein